MSRIKILLFVFTVLSISSCREEFDPPVHSSGDSFLVVEGVLNAGAEPTTISLTRTYRLDDSARLRGERNARVTVEGKDNTNQILDMVGDGIYTSPNLNLVINNEYRLRIQTTNGKEYLSEFVIARKTPEIDSIGWKLNDEGAQIYVNTNDPSGNTRYYRWDYDETWEIRSYYYTQYKYENRMVRERITGEEVFYCWKNVSNSSIHIGTSTRLQSDIIHQAPLVFVLNGDDRFSVRYSIMVRQYALDKRGYEFYELMKRNTESLGTLFDPQPSEITGNIRCITDPAEPVIGYITASTVSEKRHFINRNEIPGWRFIQACPTEIIPNNPDSLQKYFEGFLEPFEAILGPSGNIESYAGSYSYCVDCTKRGGSLIKPSFW